MRILDRYIAAQVIGSTLLALAVLVALFAFIAFIDDLGHIGRGSYTLWAAIEYQLFTLPSRAFALFPLAAVVGSLIGLGALAAGRELIIIRSSGVSSLRIAAAVLKGAGVLVLLSVATGELLAPHAENLAQQRRSVALTDRVAMQAGSGLWVRDGASFINVRELLPGDRLAGVRIYELDAERRLLAATHADGGAYRGDHWLLEHVRQSLFAEGGVEARAADRGAWRSAFRPDMVAVVSVKPEALSARGLARYIDYLRANELDTRPYELAFWYKLAFPVATAVMILLGVPIVLGRLGATGIGQRIVIGALIGISFHVVQQGSGHLGLVYGLNPAASATLPTLLFLGATLWMLARVR